MTDVRYVSRIASEAGRLLLEVDLEFRQSELPLKPFQLGQTDGETCGLGLTPVGRSGQSVPRLLTSVCETGCVRVWRRTRWCSGASKPTVARSPMPPSPRPPTSARAWLYTQPDLRGAIDDLRSRSRATADNVPVRQQASDASLLRRLTQAQDRNGDLQEQVRLLRKSRS
jgi:hypothetical protein